MTHLIITVMAIILAALLAVGGISYFSTDIGFRVSVQQALRTQHDAILTAVSSYRTANNGFVHSDIERLNGYLPDGRIPTLPGGAEPFVWAIDKDGSSFRGLCLKRPEPEDGGSLPSIDRGFAQGLVSFVKDQAARHPGKVKVGKSGGSGPCGISLEMDVNALKWGDIEDDTVMSFRGF